MGGSFLGGMIKVAKSVFDSGGGGGGGSASASAKDPGFKAESSATKASQYEKDSFSRSGRSNRYRRRLQGGGTGSVETEKKSLLGN